jgi:hypothetical protein
MIITEIEKILSDAEALAFRIANRKSVAYPSKKTHQVQVGDFFNNTNRDMESIWKDVIIAYDHFRGIDLNDLVATYREHHSTSVWRTTRHISGCEHTFLFSNTCPIDGICSTKGIYCKYYQGASSAPNSSAIKCGYKEEA